MLGVFAAALGLIEYIGGGTEKECLTAALRMMDMTVIFIYLLGTTRLQDLTASMVQQMKIPYEYAFMFTAGLRFVPDFIEENRAVAEAQACRGLSMEGNFLRKVHRYMSIVRPLMLRSLGRSETMALSLELRGFGGEKRTFMDSVAPKTADYLFMAVIAAVTAGVIAGRILRAFCWDCKKKAALSERRAAFSVLFSERRIRYNNKRIADFMKETL